MCPLSLSGNLQSAYFDNYYFILLLYVWSRDGDIFSLPEALQEMDAYS